MIPAKLAMLLGVGLLSFLFVVALYLVWTRMVGLDPTVAQWCADLSRPGRMVIALISGAALATGSLAAPTVEAGVASMVMLAASTFAALMAFEMIRQQELSAS
jgi:cytochrome c oxidase assembly factor CtaG